MKHKVLLLIAFVLTGCTATQSDIPEWSPPVMPPTVDPANVELAAAQRNYDTYCAHCHGYSGDGMGEVAAARALELGYKLVPRHDAQGHTWQHPDQLLFEIIKYGVDNPLNLYLMSGWDEQLTDDEIFGVIDYMKRFWTDEQRRHQTRLTARFTENNPNWERDHLERNQVDSP